MGNLIGTSLVMIGGGVILAIIIITFLLKMYRRASKETAFVRTGVGGEKVVIRCVARASLRAVMITLREALARSHAALLAELPLFAPLDPTELLSLCRRATEVHFGPHKGIKPVSPAGEGGFARALGPQGRVY